jgi:hypothetical protein
VRGLDLASRGVLIAGGGASAAASGGSSAGGAPASPGVATNQQMRAKTDDLGVAILHFWVRHLP